MFVADGTAGLAAFWRNGLGDFAGMSGEGSSLAFLREWSSRIAGPAGQIHYHVPHRRSAKHNITTLFVVVARVDVRKKSFQDLCPS